MLARRAMPIAAGSSHDMPVTARHAFVEHHPQLVRATGHYGVEDLLVLRGHRRAESLEIGRAVPPHHVGDGRH